MQKALFFLSVLTIDSFSEEEHFLQTVCKYLQNWLRYENWSSSIWQYHIKSAFLIHFMDQIPLQLVLGCNNVIDTSWSCNFEHGFEQP